MKVSYSEVNYRETAALLVQAGASLEAIVAELVKMGASQEVARRLSARARRAYRLKKVAPYIVGAILITAATYVVFDWPYALFIGLFSLLGLQRLYFQDKRTSKKR
ncbi:MAG: hypothetical protein MN733_11045 [Nitrososphaera sp.]|nr:hypothetical protein [Nitrososphaera sp.]